MAATNSLRVVYPAATSGAQTPLSIDWRDEAPSGYSFEIQYNAGASGSVTVETTLDDLNDTTITPDWIAETTAITADTRGVIGHPVTAVRLNVSSLTGGSLTFKLLGGSVIGDASGTAASGGGGVASAVTIADGADVALGSRTDAAYTGTQPYTAMAALRAIANAAISTAASPTNITQTGSANLVADDAAAGSAFPMPAGTIVQTVAPTYSNGDRGTLRQGVTGELLVTQSVTGTGVTTINGTAGDARSNTLAAAFTGVYAWVNNSAGTWDRQRGNTTGSIVIPPLGWQYAAAASGIVNTTTAVTIKAAAGAGIRNYISSLSIQTNGAIGAATEVAIRDGAAGTVIWRGQIGTAGLTMTCINFDNPLFGTANTLLEFLTLTASVTGAVYFNAQGFTGP